jgi:hypothetical protein
VNGRRLPIFVSGTLAWGPTVLTHGTGTTNSVLSGCESVFRRCALRRHCIGSLPACPCAD